MPVFTRRRLQAMLNDLAERKDATKVRDLVGRLEAKDAEQVLPAEMELALLWALSRLGDLDIEPEWWGDERRPDAYTEALVPNRPAVVEIAAHNDGLISGEDAMVRVANQLSDCASRIRRGVGPYLYFRFCEESGYQNGSYFRRRLAPADFRLTASIEASIRHWIDSGNIEQSRLRIVESGLDVEIEKTKHRQLRFHNVWSSMPPEAHSIDNNPLCKLLVRKIAQIKAAKPGLLRIIFLADGGSTLVHRLGQFGELDSTRRRVSAREIISHVVSTHGDRLDAVVTFAPVRESQLWERRGPQWKSFAFTRPELDIDVAAFDRVAALLPRPRFEGYQARSLIRQGAFSSVASAWNVGMHVETRGAAMKVKVSARALLDVLAGRITPEQFRFRLGERKGEKNLFQHWLDTGYTLSLVEVEYGGIDEDDDYLVLHFSDDPAARPLRMPTPTKRPPSA
jgi:hypothetical protein